MEEIDKLLFTSDFSMNQRKLLRNELPQFPVMPITRFNEYGLMLHYCITNEKITIANFQYLTSESNAHEDDLFHESPSVLSDTHASWIAEEHLLSMVEAGNLKLHEEASRLGSSINITNIGNGNSVRQIKNITIIYTALCTRASIRGGLQPNLAYTLSDHYIHSIEAAKSIPDIVEINSMMQEDFVRRVHELKLSSGISLQIKQCCSFIQVHLTEELSLTKISKYVGYSTTYLSKKFKEEMGMTISDYILQKKIELAKKLLIKSSTSVQEIGESPGFHSPSYFCEKFKKVTGVTPNHYRETHS